MPRTVEFDLHDGYEDENGISHKHVVMQAVNTDIIIAVGKDTRIRTLAKQDFQIDISAATALMSSADDLSSISGAKIDPVQMHVTQAAMLELFSILYPKVVVSIGEVPKEDITNKLFGSLSLVDMSILQTHYQDLNAIDEKLLKGEGPKENFSQKEE